MPCGDLENQRYIQTRAEMIYMCSDPAPGYKNCSYEDGYYPCYAWIMVGLMTIPGEYISPVYYYPKEWGKDNWRN
jgi:hypothetical protein